VDPKTFTATGTAVTVGEGKEGLYLFLSAWRVFINLILAGGLVAHNDGFALLTTETMPTGTSNAPPGNTPVAVLYRYTAGKQSWKTWLGGPDAHPKDGVS
jgi:hypothetical protein